MDPTGHGDFPHFPFWHLRYRIIDRFGYNVKAGYHNMKAAPTSRALPLPVRTALRKLGGTCAMPFAAAHLDAIMAQRALMSRMTLHKLGARAMARYRWALTPRCYSSWG